MAGWSLAPVPSLKDTLTSTRPPTSTAEGVVVENFIPWGWASPIATCPPALLRAQGRRSLPRHGPERGALGLGDRPRGSRPGARAPRAGPPRTRDEEQRTGRYRHRDEREEPGAAKSQDVSCRREARSAQCFSSSSGFNPSRFPQPAGARSQTRTVQSALSVKRNLSFFGSTALLSCGTLGLRTAMLMWANGFILT